MPNRDKTGPRGEGVGTGGGMGGCITEKQLNNSRKNNRDCGIGRGLPPCGKGMGGGKGGKGRRKGADGVTYFT